MKTWQRKFTDVFKTTKPILGMVHLKPLPGTPLYDSAGGMQKIVDEALADAGRLVKGGIDGIQVENQWDRPFQKGGDLGPETVACIAAAAARLRLEFDVPVGVTVHLNGVKQALAAAVAADCQWVRAFELANAYVSNAGIIEAAGPEAMRYRSFLRAEHIMVFGDFHVKHGSHHLIEDRSILEQAEDVQTALGDGVIVTGIKTGTPPSRENVEPIRNAVSIPVLIGSGLSIDNLDELLPHVDGAVVGSAFKEEGRLANPVDAERVRAFMEKVRGIRGG